MPASFWFEIRGTETYWCYPVKDANAWRREQRKKAKADVKAGRSKKPVTATKDEPIKARWDIDWNSGPAEEITADEYLRRWRSPKWKRALFIKRENEDLQRVDELICEFMGEPAPPRNRDSQWYHFCHDQMFWCMYGDDAGSTAAQPRHVEKMHERMDKAFASIRASEKSYDQEFAKTLTEGYVARAHAMLDWVFTKKWEYHAHG